MDKARDDKRRFDKETEEYQKKLELFLKNPSWASKKVGASGTDNRTTDATTSVASPPSSPAQQPNKRVRHS